MKILQSSVFRAVCAIVFGYMLVIYRHTLLHWTTIAFGALFFLSGLISVVAYYVERKRTANTAERLSAMSEMRGEEMDTPSAEDIKESLTPAFPIVGVGSMALGIMLALMPETFNRGMIYVVGGLLALGALNMMFNLLVARKFASIGIGFWVIPVLLLLLCILMFAKPDLFAEMPFRILGWAFMVYGVAECINAFKIHRCKKQYERIQAAQQAAMAEAEDAEIVSEEGNDTPSSMTSTDNENTQEGTIMAHD